jgi:hypothetical protein
MNLTELEEFYLQKHLDGMDRSAIRKELIENNTTHEDLQTVLKFIDDEVLYGTRKPHRTVLLSNKRVFGMVFIIVLASSILLGSIKNGAGVIYIPVMPTLFALFFILKFTAKKQKSKRPSSSRFKR